MGNNRKLAVIVFILAAIVLLSGCGGAKQALVPGKVNVVTSFYPLYDFTKKIGGDHVNVINLVPAGVEPHDWSPKSRDIQNLTKAEMFVYLGAGFEGWVGDFLSSMKSDAKVAVVEASAGIELIRASEEEHAREEEKAGAKGHSHDEHESEWDPHVWVSPVNAKKMAETIKTNLVKLDPNHAAEYETNYKAYAARLDKLNDEYKQSLAKAPKKQIVVTHDSFGYLAKAYGLTQMPIMGLSPDAEPTAKDLQRINAFIKSGGVKYIFFEELVSDKLAKTLAKDAGVETLVLNPVEGLTEKQLAAGEDYVSVMETNLKNLLKALQ